MGLSEFHLQRVFTEWAGVSPKQFLGYLTKEYAKRQLHFSSVQDAAFTSGLSGSSRLHDLFVTYESVTPGEIKKRGQGINICYGVHSSRFGYCFIAVTERGLCKLGFFDSSEEKEQLVSELYTDWENATIEEDSTETQSVFNRVFSSEAGADSSIKLLLKGSPFRVQVWEALLNIPTGNLVSYQQVADSIGKPSASRAVASAIAANNIGFLIPCHRVIRSTGVLSNYRWSRERKAAMIVYEQHCKPK